MSKTDVLSVEQFRKIREKSVINSKGHISIDEVSYKSITSDIKKEMTIMVNSSKKDKKRNTSHENEFEHITKDNVTCINNIVEVLMKPLSSNSVWQGRRFKNDKYKKYEAKLLEILPDVELPEPPYKITFNFGFSNKASDYDNPVKPLQDILQKRYNFDDKLIYSATINKKIVPKGKEYFEFKIEHLVNLI